MTVKANTGRLAGKRVLFVFCALELGGAERQGTYLARHLKQSGCDVRVWSTHAGSGPVTAACEELGIPWAVHRFRWPCRKSSLVRDGLRFVKELRRERPDVILSYTTWPNVGCGLLWRWTPAKLCIWGQRSVNDLRGDAIERLAYRHVSAVICNARHQVDFLRGRLGETPAPVSVIHNGVDLPAPQRTREEWRHDLGIPLDAPVVAMVANFRAEKDHPTLLRAWKELTAVMPEGVPKPRLLLAGARQTAYATVRALASELQLGDSVVFLNQVGDVSGLLAASDIGVLVSTHEGLPNAVLEYMACGLPVVATDIPGNREALGANAQGLLCPAGHPQALGSILRELISNPELRQVVGCRNRCRAAAEFSVQAMCERTAVVITGLL